MVVEKKMMSVVSVVRMGFQDAVIVGTLELLLNDHDTFSSPLVAKLSADLVRAQAVVDKIHDSIQSGINCFSS